MEMPGKDEGTGGSGADERDVRRPRGNMTVWPISRSSDVALPGCGARGRRVA